MSDQGFYTTDEEYMEGYKKVIKQVEKQISHLTLREHYAGLAMNAIVNNWNWGHMEYFGDSSAVTPQSIAKLATKLADALIEELKK